jgi:hypothetical protein
MKIVNYTLSVPAARAPGRESMSTPDDRGPLRAVIEREYFARTITHKLACGHSVAAWRCEGTPRLKRCGECRRALKKSNP